MSGEYSRLQLAQEQSESAIKKVNDKIGELGIYINRIYEELNAIQESFDDVRNVPSEKRFEYETLKETRMNWKEHVDKIEADYKVSVIKTTGNGVAGIGAGIAVAALGPTTAMGIATTFGVASTGTAISTLSGAAATNAALAWLGGGALAASGGGMVVGKVLIALTGPVGLAIAGVGLICSGLLLLKGKDDKSHLDNISTLIFKRATKSYELAIVEINERIKRIMDESDKLNCACKKTRTFGLDYNLMTEAQQYEMGSYVNLMNSSTHLLVNPIIGLQPQYNIDDLNEYMTFSKKELDDKQKSLVIYFSNLLFGVTLDLKEKELLFKSIKENKRFLSSIEMTKKDFEFPLFDIVTEALSYKYHSINSYRYLMTNFS